MCAAQRDDDGRGGDAAGQGVDVDSIAHAVNTPLAVALANTTFVLEHLAARTDLDGPTGALRGAVAESLAGLRSIQVAMEELAARVRPDDGAPVDVRVVVDRAVAASRAELAAAVVIRRFEPTAPARRGSSQVLLRALSAALARAAASSVNAGAPQVLVRISPGEAGVVAIDITTSGHGLAPAAGAVGPGEQAARQALEDALAALRATGASAVLRATEHGSSARLDLPADVAPKAAAPGGAAVARARVVVIDDEELIVKVVQRILGAEHDVVGFVDPEAALEHLLSGPRPDLVLCDLMMPRLSGADLFERVCATDPTFADRFVFLSGGGSGARPRAFLAGPTVVRLPKPFSAAVLRALVRERAGRPGPSA